MPSSLFAPLAVEIENRDRRPSRPSDSRERALVDCPSKVSVPSLPARMEKVHFAARDRIDTPNSAAFGKIARRTSQGSIREGIRPFSRPGMNVLEMKLVATNRLRRAAVLAAELGPSFDLTADRIRECHFALAFHEPDIATRAGVTARRHCGRRIASTTLIGVKRRQRPALTRQFSRVAQGDLFGIAHQRL
jgi:hypothetical protein